MRTVYYRTAHSGKQISILSKLHFKKLGASSRKVYETITACVAVFVEQVTPIFLLHRTFSKITIKAINK